MKLLAKALAIIAFSASAAFGQVTAQSYIIIAQDGRVIAEHNADDLRPLASITKLVALGEIQPGSGIISITADERDNLKHTRMRLRQGDYVQSELFEAALISSNNEAAKAVGRSVPNLIADVNERNAARGLTLKLVEPSGLDPSNVGTARSLAKLLWFIKDQPSAQISVSSSSKLARRSTNSFLGMPGWEFAVSKTGYINEAGGCLVTLTKINGEWMAVAVMGSTSVRERWLDLARLRRQVAPDDTFYEPKERQRSSKIFKHRLRRAS
jgi:D-alanyl-D-alanine endopeptidase (penicillin-binding protein 7)